ncbi:MAG: nucleotidyl transferase AbiEii/AbiGii toxin family protein [Bacteroidota bacterium]
MDLFEDEIILFFRHLAEQEVSFILVGGLAVNYHGFNRSTGDIDIWINDNSDNRKKFIAALKNYGIEGAEVYTDLPFIAGYSELMLDNGMRIDLMSELQFFKKENYDDCYKLANEFNFTEEIKIKVLHINTLISEKEQSKRPKDIIDAEALKKLYRS